MKYLKLLGPIIVLLLLFTYGRLLLAYFFPCQLNLSCPADPISNYAFIYLAYGSLTGNNFSLILPIAVFAILGLILQRRKLLFWNIIFFTTTYFLYSAISLVQYHSQTGYMAPDSLFNFFFRLSIIYALGVTFVSLLFSFSGDSIKLLQNIRNKISTRSIWYTLFIMLCFNITYVIISWLRYNIH